MSPRERAANAVGMLPMDDGDVLMDRLTDWCEDPDAFARLIVDAVLDEIREPSMALLGVMPATGDAHFKGSWPRICRDVWCAGIDAIKRGEG